jgi:hypothetical protein
MNLVPGSVRITGNYAISTTGGPQDPKPVRIFNIHLVSTSTAGSLQLFDINAAGTSSGTQAWVQVDGAASQGVSLSFAGGLRMPNGCYASVDTTWMSYAVITFSEEF